MAAIVLCAATAWSSPCHSREPQAKQAERPNLLEQYVARQRSHQTKLAAKTYATVIAAVGLRRFSPATAGQLIEGAHEEVMRDNDLTPEYRHQLLQFVKTVRTRVFGVAEKD